MNESFYLTLNSSASGEYGHKNTSSNFKTHLGKMITLEGAWEMALVECRIPMTLPNVTEKTAIITAISNDAADSLVHRYKIRSGHYGDAKVLIEELNTVLNNHMSLELDQKGLVSIDTQKDTFLTAFYLSDELHNILGLRKGEIIGQNYLHKGIEPVNVNKGIFSTFNISTNIIEHQLVDNSHNSTLRSVPTFASEYNFGFDKMYTFNRLHYKKLNCNRIEFIEINISNSKNEIVTFEHGNSSVLVHFRRCLE